MLHHRIEPSPNVFGSSRYNHGPENYKISPARIEKRERLRAVAARHGVDLRTAALQFSTAPDVAVALVVGASSEQQILQDYNSMQVKIPAEFWQELKASGLIEQAAAVPIQLKARHLCQREPSSD